jgi:pyrroloquinoline quinone (PQQ) biosynthesis protein C
MRTSVMTRGRLEAELEREILEHPALYSRFVRTLHETREPMPALRLYSLQEFQIIKAFPHYTELLIPRLPDRERREVLAKICFDLKGGDVPQEASAVQFERFMQGIGLMKRVWETARPLPETLRFIREHLTLCQQGDPDTAFGAVAAGHLCAQPVMLRPLFQQLRRADPGVAERLDYFRSQILQGALHAQRIRDLLCSHPPTSSAGGAIREGALLSLDLRELFWEGVGREAFGDSWWRPARFMSADEIDDTGD